MTRPVFTVVVPAYNAAGVVQTALATLGSQNLEEPFEVVVVDSGPHSCRDEALGLLPTARVIREPERLYPAGARNAGIRAAGGEHIAFLPADCEAPPGWLSERLRVHRQGFDAVGGSIANGFPGHPVAMAEYLLEYSALMPNADLLRQQGIPHALSFHRSVFDRFGLYPEDVRTGEDTLFNARCINGGISIGFAPHAYLAHHGSRSLRSLVAHAMEHGRGLEQCVAAHDFPSAVGPLQQPTSTAIKRMLLAYPWMGLRNKFRRLAKYEPRLLPTLAILSPIITVGMLATGFGALLEWRVRRRGL